MKEIRDILKIISGSFLRDFDREQFFDSKFQATTVFWILNKPCFSWKPNYVNPQSQSSLTDWHF